MPGGRPHRTTAWDSSSLDGLFQSSSTRRELRGSRLKAFYIRRDIHFMERHYPRELTVAEMAGACKLNRSYFSTIFKKNMGRPPQEFLIRLQLSKAADLMEGTGRSIGAMYSYPNQFHFSRAFRKRYGMSPREWRARNQIKRTR